MVFFCGDPDVRHGLTFRETQVLLTPSGSPGLEEGGLHGNHPYLTKGETLPFKSPEETGKPSMGTRAK